MFVVNYEIDYSIKKLYFIKYAVLTKLLGGALGAKFTGFSSPTSFIIGAGMVSRGEVAIIIAATGLQEALLQP